MEAKALLPWGYDQLLVDPEHYDVVYKINAYMDPSVVVDKKLARAQWEALKEALEEAGARVRVISSAPDTPDMVFAMNLGYSMAGRTKRVTILSSMRWPERQREELASVPFFSTLGELELISKERTFFEAGDAYPLGEDRLVVNIGPRTSEEAARLLAERLERELIPVRSKDPAAYHLDLAYCPLPGNSALVAPQFWPEEDFQGLSKHLDSYLILSDEEAKGQFAANSIVVGNRILIPMGVSKRVENWLSDFGMEVVRLDVSEFHKGGGSLRCLANPLDFPLP